MDLILFVFSVPRSGSMTNQELVTEFTAKIAKLLYHGGYGMSECLIACDDNPFGSKLAEAFRIWFIEFSHLQDKSDVVPIRKLSGVKSLWGVIDSASQEGQRPVIFTDPAPQIVEIVKEFLSVRRLAGFQLLGEDGIPPVQMWQLLLINLKGRTIEFLRDD